MMKATGMLEAILSLALTAGSVGAITARASTQTMNSQVRVAYHGDSGMMVSWNTFSHVQKPAVRWGLSADGLKNTAWSSESVTYPTSTTYNNHVLISGLEPDTTYFYMPMPLIHGAPGKPFNFTTSRKAGDSTPFSVAVVVDLGTMGSQGLTTTAGDGVDDTNILQPGERNTIGSLVDGLSGFDFLWHPGDIAYADYWLKEEIQDFLPNTTIEGGIEVYESILNDFYDEMMPVSANKAYMVGPGNHEANCDNGGTTDKVHNITYDSTICMPGQTNFTGFKNHFRMPSDVSGGTGNFWYSFDNGMVHFVQLDTETDLGHGFIGPDEVGGTEGIDVDPVNATMNAQSDWLQADLAAVDRSKTPWIVVAGHRPWYLSSANESGTICWTCKDVFEPLLIKYKVDLVLSGHAHVYERQTPLAEGKMDPNGLDNPGFPWYITNGAAGHYDGLDTLDSPRKPYSRFGLDTADATYGWSRLTFHNCSHMTHDFVASKNGSVIDSATLFKARTCAGASGNNTTSGNATSTVVPTSGTPAATVPANGAAKMSSVMSGSVLALLAAALYVL